MFAVSCKVRAAVMLQHCTAGLPLPADCRQGAAALHEATVSRFAFDGGWIER